MSAARRAGLGRRLALLAAGLVLSAAIAEIVARASESLRGGHDLATQLGDRLEDPLLGYRPLPGSGDHDERGFRNESVPSGADVVALGDSQTWGVNAPIDQSWPAVLASETDLVVYNMGTGGYGPLHYRVLLDEALALDPRWIVIALFLGNDVHDCYELAYGQEAHRAWRHPEPGTRRRIEESAYPDVARMFFERLNHGRRGLVRTWLSQRSALVRALAGSGLGEPDTDAEWAREHPDQGFVLERADWQTVFHPSYRLAAVDPGLLRIEEGLRIAMRALGEIQEQIEARQGTELLVVLLPTKERVYKEQIRRRGVAVPKSYDALVEGEDRIRADLVAWMRDRGVSLVDALPALAAAARQGEPLFPQNADGHFLAPGYAVIARLVAEAVATR